MNCRNVGALIAAQVDGPISIRDRRKIELHVRKCANCARAASQMAWTRNGLRSLRTHTVPPELTRKLRALGFRELAAQRQKSSARARWWNRMELHFQNGLRQSAVPFAGGLCAAVLLFAALIPTFALHSKPAIQDVPTGLSTGVAVKSLAPMGFNYGDAVVDLTIDDQGRVVEYSMVGGQGPNNEALRRSIENNLLFTVFTPATAFGQPTPGKIRLTFRSSRIEIRG